MASKEQFVVRPPKPVSEMTDDERKAFAKEVGTAMRAQMKKSTAK